MKLTVPKAVREQAAKALALHDRSPVKGVGGVVVARALADNAADEETIRRMRRFFTVNEREYITHSQLQHSMHESTLMRSWALHGGQSGKKWAEGVYKAQLAEGGEPDSWVELLRTEPTDIYAKLNFGAWTWEYGMDVRQAARFVEEYTRTHGVDFRYDKAFGESAETVKLALVRRVEGATNPFKQLSQALMRDAYRTPAKLDLKECRDALGRPALFNWPSFIATTILATHDPGAAKEIWEGEAYPWRGRDIRPVMAYAEPIGDFVTFFHPKGSCYLGDAPNGLNGRMDQLMWQVHEGEVTSEVFARDVLFEARRWTAQHRAVRGLGHTLLEAWARRDWDVILEALPLDSPVRALFEDFAGKTEGSWLAQTGL